MVVHRSGTGIVLVTPNFIEEFIPGDCAVGVLCEELQCLEFLCGHCDLFVATSHLGFGKIHDPILKDVHVFRTDARRTPKFARADEQQVPWG